MLTNSPPEPWNSFLVDIDEFVRCETQFHLLGGFVVTVIYGATRQTRDLDALTAVRFDPKLIEYAGQGSPLHKKHKVYLDPVGVAPLPEDYADRLKEVFAGTYKTYDSTPSIRTTSHSPRSSETPSATAKT